MEWNPFCTELGDNQQHRKHSDCYHIDVTPTLFFLFYARSCEMQDLCEGHHTNHNPSQNKATTYLQGAAAGLLSPFP